MVTVKCFQVTATKLDETSPKLRSWVSFSARKSIIWRFFWFLFLIGGKPVKRNSEITYRCHYIYILCFSPLPQTPRGAQNSLVFQQFYLFKDFSSLGDPCRNLIRDKCRQIKGINSFLFFFLSQKRGAFGLVKRMAFPPLPGAVSNARGCIWWGFVRGRTTCHPVLGKPFFCYFFWGFW